MRLKLEYDGNDYNQEPRGNEFETNLPINMGVEYDLFPWLRVAAAFERGRELMVRGNLHSNFMNQGRPKIDRPAPAVVPRQERVPIDSEVVAQQAVLTLPEAMDRTITVERLFDDFERLGLTVSDIEFEDRGAILRMPIESPRPSASALATAALQVARAELNGPVDTIRIIATEGGTDLWEIDLNKADLVRSISLTGSPIALVEPPDPRWLGLFPDEELNPTSAAETEAAFSKGAIERIAADVFAELDKQGFMGERFDMEGRRATVQFSQTRYRNPAIAVGRGARAVARHLPPDIEQISVVLTELGVPISKTTIMRSQLEKALQDQGSPEEIWQTAELDAVPFEDTQGGVRNGDRYPRFDWSLTPNLRTQTGGPDRFIFYQLYGRAGATVELADGLSISGAVGRNIYNNFDSLKLKSDSKLRRVRSDIAEYLKQGDFWIDTLHANYITRITPEIYARASAGIFELMFTGIGGEVLYRPEGKRWALGLDVNYVHQRDFDGGFKLQNYDVVTGHLSYYHEWPFFGIRSVVRAGHYLAKDWGATLDLSRTFENGVTFGVFATKTDVSSSEFGEGSFDKGFYISLPLDVFLSKPSRRSAGFLYRPVTRDGGQFLAIPSPLYGFTGGAASSEVSRGWNQLLD